MSDKTNQDQNFDAADEKPTEIIPAGDLQAASTVEDEVSVPETELLDIEQNPHSGENLHTQQGESDNSASAQAKADSAETHAIGDGVHSESRWESIKRQLHLGSTRRKMLAGSAIGLLLLGGIGVAAHEMIEHATRHAVHTEFERQHGHHDRPGRAHHEHGRHGHERDGRDTERPGHERDAEDPTLTRTDSPRGDAPQSSDRAQSGDNAQSSDTAQSADTSQSATRR